MIDIVSNATDLARRYRDLPERVRTGVQKGLKRGLLLLEDDVRANADLRFTGGRSGLLSRLVSFTELGPGAVGISGVIGFRKTRNFPYEMSQEFGAKAKPGGAMAIPVSDEARALSQRGVSARDFPRHLFIPGAAAAAEASLSKSAVLAETQGNTLFVHYVLVKSIPPRLHFRDTIAKGTRMVAEEVMKEALSDV